MNAQRKLVWRSLDAVPVPSLAAYEASGGGTGLRQVQQQPASWILDTIDESGLRGRGGGGFPTGVKFRTVAASRSDRTATTVVVNGAEGEPGTFKDRALLRTNPYRVLEGALVAAAAVGATAIKVGLKASFQREIQRLSRAIDEATAAGWFRDTDIEVVLGPSSYLFGEETGMLEVIEGRQPFPRVSPPFRRGLEDRDTRSAGGVDLASVGGSDEAPALVDNVETLANVALIAAHGPGWFRELGTDSSPGTIVCTISGATRRHGVGEVAMGTTLREAIDLIGWGGQRNREILLVVSGTANALIPASLLDTPLTYEAMSEVGTGLGSAGFIVFDNESDPVAIARGISRFLAVESCGQCEPCKSDGLALSVELEHLERSDITDRQMADLKGRVETVTIGARCNLASQQAEVVSSLLALFGESVDAHAGRRVPAAAPVVIVPIASLSRGRAVPDLEQLRKQPDWSTDPTDSGTAPAARLGDTPVHISTDSVQDRWSDWSAAVNDDHPLLILDEDHDVLDRLLGEARSVDGADRADVLAELAHFVRLHIDVVGRILYPMARRHGGDAGESMTDNAERQEPDLLAALDRLERASGEQWARSVADLGDELRLQADHEDAVVEALRVSMDPDERASLADGLTEARLTSTVDTGETAWRA